MIIDPRFVDVDFTKEAPYVRGDNATRPFRSVRKSYEDAFADTLIPESQWPAEAEKIKDGDGLDWLVTRVLDQGQEGSCVGNAATQQHQIIQAKTFGIDNVVQLSAISLYQLIGSSANSGSSIEDALTETTKTGIVPLDNPENRAKFGSVVMPPTGFRSPRPSGWQAVAQKFRTDEQLVIESVQGMMSALFSGHPIVVGRAGHSICYVRPVYSGSTLYAMYVNSWGEWGQAAGRFTYGFGLDSLSYIRQSANWCYAVRTIVNPGII